jgi:hypothetical protein
MNNYFISNGNNIEIRHHDWVEIVNGLFPPDDSNGLSFEVSSLYDCEIGIMVKLDGFQYSEVILSPLYIVSNYRRVA